MNQDNKNRIIISITTIALLLAVTIISITLFLDNNKERTTVSLRQLYVSETKLNYLIDNYFYTKNDNDTTIIKAEEYEINIPYVLEYDNIYKTLDNNYILYQNKDNNFVAYSFDGKEINKIYELDENVEPILYTESSNVYIVGFKVANDNNQILYSCSGSNPITLDDIEDIIAISQEYYLIKKNDKYGVININGETIIKPIYNNIEITNNNLFIVQNSKKLYGIIDQTEKTIITFKYNYITKKGKYYLIVNNANKLSVLDNELNTIIDYQMNYNQSSNSLDLYENNNKIFIINNKDESNKKIKYQYHDMYVIENKKIIETISENQVFGSDEFLYYLKNNNLYSYDETSNLKIKDSEETIINVNKINNDLIEVTTYVNKEEKYKYFNKSFKEIINNNKDIIYDNDKILIFSEEKSLIVTDENGEMLKEIKDTNILYYNEYVIVNNGLYKIIIK